MVFNLRNPLNRFILLLHISICPSLRLNLNWAKIIWLIFLHEGCKYEYSKWIFRCQDWTNVFRDNLILNEILHRIFILQEGLCIINKNNVFHSFFRPWNHMSAITGVYYCQHAKLNISEIVWTLFHKIIKCV
jgi:hypothetical protein